MIPSLSTPGRRHPLVQILSLCLGLISAFAESNAPKATEEATPAAAQEAFPFSEIGERAAKQYQGDAIGLEATASGASLWSQFQKLSATVGASGLHLQSTETHGGALHLVARAVGRSEAPETLLLPEGRVEAGPQPVRFIRPGLVEEYSASMDGIRQDFVVTESPAGSGDLRVRLALEGAKAEPIAGGVRLQLDGSTRHLSYHRLHVTDSTGRVLEAFWEVQDPIRIAIRVIDAGAQYPVRIDPTFSNADWTALGSGIGNVQVRCLLKNGSDLYVGGAFTNPGNRIMKWNGSSWSSLGTGIGNNYVYALAMVGTTLYAGGDFTSAGGASISYLAKWDGTSWSAVGGGVNGTVETLAAVGSDLYVGGNFTTAGGSSAKYVAKWDGSNWSTFGTGLDGRVYDLAVSGGTLYVGGFFANAGGSAASRVAQWNGTSWSAIGSGLTQTVYKLAVSGSDLYAAGNFSAQNCIAKWDGTSWSALGQGVDSTIRALAVNGTDVYVGGFFANAGGNPAASIATWNGTTWSPIGSGTASSVFALHVSGSALYVGGNFTTAGGKSINRIAQVALACDDPTSGGDIDGNQSGDSPFTPATLTSVSGASGHTGTLEYKWQSSTTSSSAGFSDVSGANATTYTPGALTQTTWFKRLARVDCRSDWTEAATSDVVQITVIGPATQLALTTSAAGAASGAAFTTQPVVTIQDANGNTVTSDSASVVTMTVSTGATIVGTATATATSGVATFSTVGLTGVTATYTLTFASGALTTATQSITVPNAAPVTTNPTLTRGVKVFKLQLSALATDANLDTLTFSALSSTTGANVYTNAGYLFYVASVSGATQNDTVSYTVSDGRLSANGTLTLTYTGAAQSGQAQSISAVAGQITVRFAGIPGTSYRVQRADDSGFSVNLSLSSAITFPSSGIYTYTDPSPPASSAYYRLIAN